MAESELGYIDGIKKIDVIEGTWRFDEDDFLLLAMLCDPIFMAELLFEDPLKHEYAGCYRVMDYQYPLFRAPVTYAAFPCARSVGKALAADELVLTPGGWTPICALAPGDSVIGSDGRPTEVLGVYPQGIRDLFEVEFTDETIVRCDADHIWLVTCDAWKRRPPSLRQRRTHELAASAMRYKVPLPDPVHFDPSGPLPLAPWLLGALLGDGGFSSHHSLKFSAADPHMVERVRREAAPGSELVAERSSEIDFWFKGAGLLHQFKAWGLYPATSSDLFVPEPYKWASVEARRELLAGLVDADGTILPVGGYEVSSASERLAADVRHLALSLGGRARVRRASAGYRGDGGRYVECKDRHRVTFQLPDELALLPTKAAALRGATARRKRDTAWRGIREVRPYKRGGAVCIEVAASDGLFVTRDFVLTHNTESIKARSCSHAFKRVGEDLLLTAPELIHLEALTQHVEQRITDVRLLREFLKQDQQKTGFTHKPFQVDFTDGTRIIGRIPKLSGTGVKGIHEPDLIVDEAQDYPARGWTEVHETVMKDHTDSTGEYDFTYHLYGVHSGAAGGRFERLADSGEFVVRGITAIMRPGWGPKEKQAAAAMYGGVHSPDYRRNILGEPGTALSQFFVTARLMACLDQDSESVYNMTEFADVQLMVEDADKMLGPGGDIAALLDLPELGRKPVYAGMDIGLVNDPTVIVLFTAEKDKSGAERLKLIRMIHLWRFRERQIREACYRIDMKYGKYLRSFGADMTGLGLPLLQGMEDDELCPDHLREVLRGYVFNAKVPVGVDEAHVSKQGDKLFDQYGNIVKEERDIWTGQTRFVSMMTMIEASTRYLRNWVDTGYLMLPFHQGLVKDMQGETEQRVRAMGSPHVRKKPSAFHMLDAMRAMAMAAKADEVDEIVAPTHTPVMEQAVDLTPGIGGGMAIA